jgi:hypothetical protein
MRVLVLFEIEDLNESQFARIVPLHKPDPFQLREITVNVETFTVRENFCLNSQWAVFQSSLPIS